MAAEVRIRQVALLLATGASDEQAALELGLVLEDVKAFRRRKAFKDFHREFEARMVADRRAALRDTLMEHAGQARQVFVDNMTQKEDRGLRQRAAEFVWTMTIGDQPREEPKQKGYGLHVELDLPPEEARRWMHVIEQASERVAARELARRLQQNGEHTIPTEAIDVLEVAGDLPGDRSEGDNSGG